MPLVALGTQAGTIDVVDVAANAVAASFAVHNGMVRGLRWLGNSRLVSFSYSQVQSKWQWQHHLINDVLLLVLLDDLNHLVKHSTIYFILIGFNY